MCSIFLMFAFACSSVSCFSCDEFLLTKDFSGKVLVSEVAKKCHDVSEEEDSISSSLIAESLEHSNASVVCAIIGLQCMGINDITFYELTTSLLSKTEFFQGRKFVIDISENGITPNSALLLKKWLNKPEIVYINVCGNTRCSMKNVRELCRALLKVVDGDTETSKKETVRNWMAKIIFLSKYYLWQAQNRVKTYSSLCEEGLLPADWADKHKNYYRTIEKIKDEDIFKMGELKETD
ncbi:MAG: hypothetical protein FADNKDHG_01627 [Holosporales bacterium]